MYLYDESGIIGAVQTYNTTTETFYFDRNIKGDVIGIYNASGAKIAKYSYDSWGNSKVTTLSSNNFSAYNPIRYRGYYYDAESSFYFLNARYYNPAWRRFISPDNTAYLDPDTPSGLNLYAYCNNDPVNYSDPSGNILIPAWIIGMGIGFAIGFASSVFSDLITTDLRDIDNIQALLKCINLEKAIVSGLFGAASGLFANIAIPFEILILSNALLSAGESIVMDVFYRGETEPKLSIMDIAVRATINAAVSALFTAAFVDSSSQETRRLYKKARKSAKRLRTEVVHPDNKPELLANISMCEKAQKKIAINSVIDALTISPVQKLYEQVLYIYCMVAK